MRLLSGNTASIGHGCQSNSIFPVFGQVNGFAADLVTHLNPFANKYLTFFFTLNSSPIDELGNWCLKG